MEMLEARIQHLHQLQKVDRAKYKATWKIRQEKKAKQRVDAASKRTTAVKRKVELTRPNKMVSKPTTIPAEAPKMVETTPVIVAMEPKAKANEVPTESTSHEATSKDATAVIIHATSSGPTPINFSPLEVVTKTEVKKMIRLAMDSFAENQKAENEVFKCTLQQAIVTQFSILGESLILNLQQAQMRLSSVVVAPMSLPSTQPPPLVTHTSNP